MTDRISACFAALKAQNKTALISFTMAGDASLEASEKLLMALPDSGADIVELGMPFSDPTADGPSIQEAGIRALRAGTKLKNILAMATRFRAQHPNTPLILMGYYNPIMQYTLRENHSFAEAAAKAGVDGLIIVDLPPEEEQEIMPEMEAHGLALIRLIAPTTDGERTQKLMQNASGFVYTIAIKGITGTGSADETALAARVAEVKTHTNLPVVVGFGIKTPAQAASLKDAADGVVVGSAIVDCFAKQGKEEALALVEGLATALHR